MPWGSKQVWVDIYDATGIDVPALRVGLAEELNRAPSDPTLDSVTLLAALDLAASPTQ